jgi:5-methylcytosine-specific restriction endonuclease McrA
MAKVKQRHLGGLPPKYSFMVNPYPEERVSRCPLCDCKTGQRKIPILIHVNPHHLIALNYTCRYCRDCDLLVAHKHEIEYYLTALFIQQAPDAIRQRRGYANGNDYLAVGTVEKSVWKEGLKQNQVINEFLPHTSDFATYYQELQLTRAGYYKVGQKPPVAVPPPSQDWVKINPNQVGIKR